MRILQVTATFPPKSFGGVAAASYNIARSLSSRDHEVTVFTTDFADSSSRLLRQPRIAQVGRVRVLYFRNLSNRLANWRMFTPVMMIPAMKNELSEFDIVHLHDFRGLPSIAVHRYARTSDVPYVLQAHGSIISPFHKGGFKSAFDHIWGASLISDATKLVAVAPPESRQYQSIGASLDKITIIPNGVDVEQFKCLPKRGLVRERLRISDETKLVLYFGRVHRTKRVDLLVRAFGGVLHRVKNAVLVIAGPDDGDLKAVLRCIQDLGLADKVQYVGPVREAEKPAFFVDADLFVMPSPYEVFGIVTLESLVCGTPTLVTDGCGIADMIRDNGFGYIAPAGSVAGLETEILHALEDEELGHAKALRAREFILQNLSWSAIIEKLEALYLECTASD